MASESTRDRRERLDAITAHIGSSEHTADDVKWLRDIANRTRTR